MIVPLADYLKSRPRFILHMTGRLLAFYILWILPFQHSNWSWLKSIAFATLPSGLFSCCFMFFTQLSHLTPREFDTSRQMMIALREKQPNSSVPVRTYAPSVMR